MRQRAGSLLLLVLLVLLLPISAESRSIHSFTCNDCHRTGSSPTALNSLCLKCHDESRTELLSMSDGRMTLPTRRFVQDDASNAFGSMGVAYNPVSAKEISHMWAAADLKPEAGANPPTNYVFYGRNNIAKGKVACARCHNSHGLDDVNRLNLKLDNTNDAMCMDCHRDWYKNNDKALLTHPVGPSVVMGSSDPRFNPGGAVINIYNTATIRLLPGVDSNPDYVSCTSCHGVHYTDSDATTADGYAAQGALHGDGHQLRSDGPTRANKSALCQSCHAYAEHGRSDYEPTNDLDAVNEQVGCLVCHSGHSYDTTSPNYYVLRKAPTTAGFGAKTTLVPTNTTDFYAYCTACHGAVTGYTSRVHTLADNCKGCHDHAATAYSFAMGANAEICGDCHGAPPRSAVKATRGDMIVETGFADGPDVDYDGVPTQYYKDETRTPHKIHAGALNTDKAAVDYAFGSTAGGIDSACNPCHNDRTDTVTPTHDTGVSNGSFQSMAFDSLATYSNVLTSPQYKLDTPNQWTCDGIYCHSNGGKRQADGTKTLAADFKTVRTPAWLDGSNPGMIVGQATECQFCHGDDSASMLTGVRDNSPTHQRHLIKLGGISKTKCYLCHSNTVGSDGVVPATARNHRTGSGGKHVNGIPDVFFDATALGGGLTTGSYTGGNQGTCAVYCHNPRTTDDAGGTVDWDSYTGVAKACDFCHEGKTGNTIVIDTGAHYRHITDPNGPKLLCANCHGDNADAGTQTGHIDGVVTYRAPTGGFGNICQECHGYEAGEVEPEWYTLASGTCESCHTGTKLSTIGGTAAPDKSAALTRGHNRTTNYPVSNNLPGSKSCKDCHSTTQLGHFDGFHNNDKLLVAAAATCTTSCHGVGGSAVKDGIVTHMPTITVPLVCTACHDPHGDATVANIFMIRSTSASYSGTVNFTNRGNDSDPLSATNSYDEDDNGITGYQASSEVNGDDICATCHSNVATDPNATGHNNRQGTDNSAGHNMGKNCFTSCHKTHTEPSGAFISVGDGCNACHGNPPVTGAHRDVRGDRSLEPSAIELHSKTASNALTETRDDCARCHTGANLYTFDPSGDRASLTVGRLNHGAGTRISILSSTVGYTQNGNLWYCATACHLSGTTDGFWFDKSVGTNKETWNKDDALNCSACHYYVVGATSSANNTAAAPKDLKGSHNAHFAKLKPCTACHTVLADTTHISIPLTGTDLEKITNRATADQNEADVLVAIATQNDPGNETCFGANIGLGCHNTKTTPAWTTTGITCTNCHTAGGGAAYDPTSGLHNMTAANVQKHNDTLRTGCTECHASMTSDPASHIDGVWLADGSTNQTVGGQPRFLSGTRTSMVYSEGAANASTCWDNGASGASTSLDYNGGVAPGCHRDNGVWKRLWTNEADSTETAPGTPRCKACHGQYVNLNSNQGGGWNENTSHYLTFGGRSSVRGESHNSRVLGDNSACEDCHSYPSLSNHENGSLNINDGGATNIIVDGAPPAARCAICHAWGNPLTDGTFTFTPSAAFPLVAVTGGYDPIMQCNSCHGVGGSGRFWPVGNSADLDNTAGRHEIHMDRLAKKVYGETIAQLLTATAETSEVKQKNLCEYCHTAPAGFSGHHLEALPAEVPIKNLWNKAVDTGATYSSNQHGAGGADTCASVNCHNNKLTVDNSYGWYDATTGAGCVVCHTVGGTNDLPNNNIHPTTGLHNVTPTVSGVKHDDSFSVSGTCNSCHTGIVSAMVGSNHINGAAAADVVNNTDRGLFAAYTDAAANTGTCFGTGVDNSTNCHADGGTWKRRWSTTANVSDGVTECANCHGTFTTGWRWDNPAPAGTTDHSDPSALNTGGTGGDAMGYAGMHPDCQICHGWGKAGYLTAWQNKTAGATPGHGDGRITMNGPDDTPGPGAGAKYDDSTGGCAAACHSATWVLSDSGLTPNYGDYGAGSCDGCHGVTGAGQYWPNGSGGNPAYVDDNANSASRHDTHLATIAQYKWGMTLTQLKANEANQKAACAFCHASPGAGGHNSDSGDQRVDVAGAGAFRKFTGSTNDAVDAGAGAYATATRSCSNLVCHNLVTTPTVAADSWEGTTAANCTTLCHGPNTVATAREGHQKHVVTKAYACTQCHPNNGTNYQHINGTVTLNFLNGSAPTASYSDGSFPFDRTNPTGTCTNVYCHVDKQTPAWNATISATGCVDCHTVGGAGNNPTSGLHNMTANGVQPHNNTLRNGCTECHAPLTSAPSTHIDGVWYPDSNVNQSDGWAPRFLSGTRTGLLYSEGAANASTCWDSGATGASTSLDYNGGVAPGCHRDDGKWKRLWSTAADVDISGSKNPGQLVCDVCHGQYQTLVGGSKGWREGTVHYRSGAAGVAEDKGKSHNRTSGTPVANACDDCHAYPSAIGVHENSAINFSGGAGVPGTYTVTWGNNATPANQGWYCATCHTQSTDDAFDTTSHTFPDSTAFATRTYVVGTTQPEGGCTGCHGNLGTGQYWPDGSIDNASYDWADDGSNEVHTGNGAGTHGLHLDIMADWADDGLRNNSVPTVEFKNGLCNYCHPNPGGSGHFGLPGDRRVDVYQSGEFLHVVTGDPNGSGAFNYDTDGTCSTIKCHARAPFTPGWWGDTLAPGNVTVNAELGSVPRSIRLWWVAPGDDGTTDGTAYKYDIRMSKNDGGTGAANFSPLATNYVQGVPTVKRKGDVQEAIIHNVDPNTTYYFAMRTYDEKVIATPGTLQFGTGTATFAPRTAAELDSVAPVLIGSPAWYGLDTAKALDDGSVKLSWTRAEDHSMPITYDIWWKTGGAINFAVDPVTASTGDTSFRVSAADLSADTFNFAVRARDSYGNRDVNANVLQALPQALFPVPKTSQTHFSGGAIAGSNVTMNYSGYSGAGTSTALTIYFLAESVFATKTNVYADTFAVYVSNTNASNTITAELGYYDGTFKPFNLTSPAQTVLSKVVTLASKAKKVIPFKLGDMRWVPANAKLAVKLTQTAAGTINWGTSVNRGDLTTQIQPVDLAPTAPVLSAVVDTTPGKLGNVNISWTAATEPVNDGVNDTIHYDVYGDVGDGPLAGKYPYVIATGLTANALPGTPLVWDTQASGIASSSLLRVKVEAGEAVGTKTISHTASNIVTRSVNNTNDNVAPGMITNFKAETRPKQGSVYLSWTAPGDDGDNNGRATAYDIRWATAVIDNDTKFNAAVDNQLVSEPYPDFGGNGQGYEVLGLPDGNYFFAIKALDDKPTTPNASPLAFTLAIEPTAAGPKCGICHSTPPDEFATKGNHVKHGYTMTDCGKCHGTEAETFTTDHQDNKLMLGWKGYPAVEGVVNDLAGTVVYTQNSQVIYQDLTGVAGFNVTSGGSDVPENLDNGTCSGWSTLQVSGCHGSASNVLWNDAVDNKLACSACHGDPLRTTDNYAHSFDDAKEDVKASPPIDNHGFVGLPTDPIAERKYVGAHIAHLNYSFRLSKGDSCRMCHGASRPGVSIHADGIIDVTLDPAAAGATNTWVEGDAVTAGTCASTSPDSCHPPLTGNPTGVVSWDSAVNFDCNNCHGMNSNVPMHVTDPIKSVSDPAGNNAVIPVAERMPGNCTWCHVGGHPKEKDIVDGVGGITKASPAVVTTKNNHNLATGDKITIHTSTGMTQINNKTFSVTVLTPTTFSLQGSNSTTYSDFVRGTWIEGNGTGIILVPNNTLVGINYTSGGIHLKANIGVRGEMNSEAELCWSCHYSQSTPISEWGADTGLNNTATAPGNGNVFNYGQISLSVAGGAAISNWLGDGTGAFWRSGYTPGFNYKDGRIRSTHSTDPTGSSALIAGSAYTYAKTANSERLDPVNIIRCSNCHDVHNLNKAPDDNPGKLAALNGPPYLRGTWKSNPYKEDGAPQLNTVYTAPASGTPGFGFGLVPRANPSTTQAMGGYWIDQNSNNPTAGWSYETSAGLCQLCHSKTVDGLEVTVDNGTSGLWISATNGHANSVLGSSGINAANIFRTGFDGTTGAGRQGDGNPLIAPWMGFENTPAGSGTYSFAYRSSRANGGPGNQLSPGTEQALWANLSFAWGVTVDAGTTETGYHQFSCSKCHNPHASRLPKLMITNCLDVSLNTWDTGAYKTDTDWTARLTGSPTALSWGTRRISMTSAAQNCHRYINIGNDATPEEKGWNKVTPWSTYAP